MNSSTRLIPLGALFALSIGLVYGAPKQPVYVGSRVCANEMINGA